MGTLSLSFPFCLSLIYFTTITKHVIQITLVGAIVCVSCGLCVGGILSTWRKPTSLTWLPRNQLSCWHRVSKCRKQKHLLQSMNWLVLCMLCYALPLSCTMWNFLLFSPVLLDEAHAKPFTVAPPVMSGLVKNLHSLDQGRPVTSIYHVGHILCSLNMYNNTMLCMYHNWNNCFSKLGLFFIYLYETFVFIHFFQSI